MNRKAAEMMIQFTIGLIFTAFLIFTSYKIASDGLNYLYPSGPERDFVDNWANDINGLKDGRTTQLIPIAEDRRDALFDKYVFLFFDYNTKSVELKQYKNDWAPIFKRGKDSRLCAYSLDKEKITYCAEINVNRFRLGYLQNSPAFKVIVAFPTATHMPARYGANGYTFSAKFISGEKVLDLASSVASQKFISYKQLDLDEVLTLYIKVGEGDYLDAVPATPLWIKKEKDYLYFCGTNRDECLARSPEFYSSIVSKAAQTINSAKENEFFKVDKLPYSMRDYLMVLFSEDTNVASVIMPDAVYKVVKIGNGRKICLFDRVSKSTIVCEETTAKWVSSSQSYVGYYSYSYLYDPVDFKKVGEYLFACDSTDNCDTTRIPKLKSAVDNFFVSLDDGKIHQFKLPEDLKGNLIPVFFSETGKQMEITRHIEGDDADHNIIDVDISSIQFSNPLSGSALCLLERGFNNTVYCRSLGASRLFAGETVDAILYDPKYPEYWTDGYAQYASKKRYVATIDENENSIAIRNTLDFGLKKEGQVMRFCGGAGDGCT